MYVHAFEVGLALYVYAGRDTSFRSIFRDMEHAYTICARVYMHAFEDAWKVCIHLQSGERFTYIFTCVKLLTNIPAGRSSSICPLSLTLTAVQNIYTRRQTNIYHTAIQIEYEMSPAKYARDALVDPFFAA